MSTIPQGGNRGFTLIEVIVVVAIVAILATIAVPAYSEYTRRAQRVDATATLLRIQNAQEKYYLQNNTYADDASVDLGIAGTEHGYYTIALTGVSAVNFTATATPNGPPQAADDTCQFFSVNAQNVKAATDVGGNDSSAECWR